MALYKTSLEVITRHSRLLSYVAARRTKLKVVRNRWIPGLEGLEGASNLDSEKWSSLRKESLESQSASQSPDIPIIQFCLASKNPGLGKSYMKYLKENKIDLGAALVGRYFQLLYLNRDSITEADQNEILAMYDELRVKHPLLDCVTAEYCIMGISRTKRWKETAELLELMKLSSTPNPASCSAIIIAAFDNGDPEFGWKYFGECAKLKIAPHSDAYIAYVDYCSKNFKDPDTCVDEIGKLLNFIAQHDLLPYENVIYHIRSTFERLGWVGNFVKLTNQGVCKHCKHRLEPLKLSASDFSHLSKTVLDKALVGDNVYSRTSPDELRKFLNYIRKTKPYNVVIDGLNVGYSNQVQGAPSAKRLATLVRYFLDKNQVVLVLGREHMLRWDKHAINYVKKNAFLFLTDNLSADDPCLLYAALASGSETKFVTKDLMRQHKFLLRDTSLDNLFKRWQMSHQCFVQFKKEQMTLIPPLNYLPAAQRGENCWHIPYKLVDAPLTESYEAPSEWLCLERRRAR